MRATFLAGVLLSLGVFAAPPRTTVVVIIDRSVADYRFALARQAARELVDALPPGDRLGFIAAGGTELTQSGSRELNDDGRARLRTWLDQLEPATGSEALGLGPTMQMAEGLLGLTREGTQGARLLLVSDGAHVPGVLSNAQLQQLVTSLVKRGVRVDAVSPGKPSVRPPLEALAELGNGRLAVLEKAGEVRALFGAKAGSTMTWPELEAKVRGFAKGGGGELHVVAIARAQRAGYELSHWAGFFTTRALQQGPEPLAWPEPPLLLVANHPSSREAKNQAVVEELVRWEPDGTIVSTGVVYSKWGEPAQGSDAFRTGAAKLLGAPSQQ